MNITQRLDEKALLQAAHTLEMSNSKIHINSCPSLASCKYAVDDSTELEKKLTEALHSFDFPAKVKIGVSGCLMCCTMPKVRDLGFIATRKGWELHFGGNGGNKPRIADLIGSNLTTDQAVHLAATCLKIYQENASIKMRTSSFVTKFSLELLKHKIQDKL